MLIKVRVMTGTGRMSMWFDAYAESLWVLVTGSVRVQPWWQAVHSTGSGGSPTWRCWKRTGASA